MDKIAKVLKRKNLKVQNWVRKNRLEAAILALILLVGAYFRLYRIEEYMTFLGDEGRDAIVVRRLMVNFDPILVGPGTSIGNMYLGPLYYYMMAPALLLANFSPAGPAIQIALLGVATIFFVWLLAREWFGKIAAIVASFLYAISPVVINYSRSSWNPNIMPFFALLCVYSVWRVWQHYEWKWLIIIGISYAFVLQSHYLGLLLVPVIGFFWLLTLKSIRDKKQGTRKFLSYTLYATILFLVLMSPLVIFDARHGWRNFSAIHKFFTQRQTTVSARPWTAFPKLPEIINKAVVRLVTGTNERVGKIATYFIFFPTLMLSVLMLYNDRTKGILSKRKLNAFFLLLIWMAVAFIGLGVYKQEIYDHYYGFFFTAPFLLIGGLSENIIRYKKFLGSLVVLVAVFFLASASLERNPLKYPPNRQLQRTQEVAQKMIEASGGEKFNIAVIAERNYEGAYQYFLEVWNAPFVIIDPQRYEETVTDQLFVVCELPKGNCDPLNHPKAEIANFGWKKIDDKWEVAGVLLYKLGHTQ